MWASNTTDEEGILGTLQVGSITGGHAWCRCVTRTLNHVASHQLNWARLLPTPNSFISGDHMKHLSTIAGDLLHRCAQTLDTSVDALVKEFEVGLKPGVDNYARKLVEFCDSKALGNLCSSIGERISDGSLSRLTYDMMLAWETPSRIEELPYTESVAKEKQDRRETLEGNIGQIHDDVSLFYSDIMPLLVNEERSVGEDAFVWLASLLPLAADVVNARFTFETLTAPTASRLYFPAYDRFLKELHNCVTYLRRQSTPTGVELAEDEFILHVEGTPTTQRVVRHIGATSWPGRLTLTNQALYFEASGAISYENALKIDLSNPKIDHQVKAASTGPWGVPLFDKAIVYESSQQSEPVVLEFPEMTSSTRRDHWLALIKEVILLHSFISKFVIESPLQAWEMHARTILGVIRLHAAREMLRISPPLPTNFLIFSLFDDLPKGDYVLEELSNSLKQIITVHPCSATSILKNLEISHPIVSSIEISEENEQHMSSQVNTLASLETTVTQVREEAKDIGIAKATARGLKEEGISDGLLTFTELLCPLKNVLPWLKGIFMWERPVVTFTVLALIIAIIYKEWVGYALAAFLMWVVGFMLWARRQSMRDRCIEIVVSTSSDQTTMESIAAAQHSLNNLRAVIQTANIAILKIQSILISRAPKHANQVMLLATGMAATLMVIPFKFLIISSMLCFFLANSMAGKSKSSEQGSRRLREWWDSIPVVPVRTINSPT